MYEVGWSEYEDEEYGLNSLEGSRSQKVSFQALTRIIRLLYWSGEKSAGTEYWVCILRIRGLGRQARIWEGHSLVGLRNVANESSGLQRILLNNSELLKICNFRRWIKLRLLVLWLSARLAMPRLVTLGRHTGNFLVANFSRTHTINTNTVQRMSSASQKLRYLLVN